MPDLEALNGVAAADIEAVNGVAKANIEAINGVSVVSGSAAATRWALASIDHDISWANAADIATQAVWESNYYNINNVSADTTDIAYGLDGSGNAKWMVTGLDGSDEILFDGNNDITDESAWSSENTSGGRPIKILFGVGDGETDDSSGSDVTRASAWLTVGRTTSGVINVNRSVDGGSNWTAFNLNGLTNIGSGSSDHHMYGLASDGTGNWMCAQKGNLYFSSDSGVSFSFLIQPTGNGTHFIRDIVFTNNTWVVITKQGADLHVSTCANAVKTSMDDASDWSTSTHIVDTGGSNDLNGNAGADSVEAAAAGGNVVVIDGVNSQAFTVSGTTITMVGTRQSIPLTETPANCIATDGTTWLIGCGDNNDKGDICRSTDNGANWALIVENLNAAGVTPVLSIAPNVVLPL